MSHISLDLSHVVNNSKWISEQLEWPLVHHKIYIKSIIYCKSSRKEEGGGCNIDSIRAFKVGDWNFWRKIGKDLFVRGDPVSSKDPK